MAKLVSRYICYGDATTDYKKAFSRMVFDSGFDSLRGTDVESRSSSLRTQTILK